MSAYETIIGIEIHCELKTQSKMFSPAPNQFGSAPNSKVHPIDLAFPGVMPVLNKQAVAYAIMAATALHMTIDREVWFDRKNYFYPDLPKGYQITQDKRPIGSKGYLDVMVQGTHRRIRIQRLHMEEDTAKQLHREKDTLLDYNRCGVPLIEIVSHPDMHSAEEAAAYVDTLRNVLLYTGVSDVKMEEGSMRCDINISLRPLGQIPFGVKTEIKNLNSISNIQRAVAYEIERQRNLLDLGQKVEQETRRFDEATRTTVLMRKKTDAVDYKYFTEPNIAPIRLSEEWIQKVQAAMPELPEQKRTRYETRYGLPESDINTLLAQRETAAYYESGLLHTKEAKSLANWVLSDVMAYCNKQLIPLDQFPISGERLAGLVNLVAEGKVSSKQAKQLFERMLTKPQSALELANEQRMVQISDEATLMEWVDEVLRDFPEAIASYRSGKTNLLGFLVGQVIKKSQGRANPAMVQRLMSERLS